MAGWRLVVLNGPNLGRLGQREPEIYGSVTHDELVASCREWGRRNGHRVEVRQTDSEGELIRFVHEAAGGADALVINAAGYTHTSVALRDALLAVDLPSVELHITNPWRREPFRQRNLLHDVVTASVFGFGTGGYRLALTGAVELLSARAGGSGNQAPAPKKKS